MSDRPRSTFLPTLALTAGGLGLLRPAPGTWGSLPPAAIAAALLWLGAPWWVVNVALGGLLALGSLACLRYGDEGERIFGKKDPGSVVADEVAGQALTLLFLPWPGESRGIALAALVGFLTFRAMDIVKPPPARGLQRIRGGAGILVDDLIAGVYAAIVTQAVVRIALT